MTEPADNEADLRAVVVDEWLTAAGFNSPEIKREAAFSVQFGTARKSTTYSDYLISRDGEPLMVIEAKRAQHPLDDDDGQQAISYARLAGAPLAVLTNGADAALYRTFDGKPLTQDEVRLKGAFWGTGDAYAGLDDLELRLRALASLISLNEENLVSFCEAQLAENTKNLVRGALGNTFGYDPVLHVERSQLRERFQEFLVGTDPVFAVTGPSGAGKSDSVIHLAMASTRDSLPLYVPVGTLGGAFLDALADQFNYAFTEQRSPLTLLKTLARIARKSDRSVIAFVDDVDRTDVRTLRTELDIFGSFAEGSHGAMRLVVAAQPGTWSALCTDGPSPSRLATRTRTECDASAVPRPHVELARFNESEFSKAIEKLQAHYATKGSCDMEIASFPLLARLIFAACEGKRVPSEITPEVAGQFFTRWMNRKTDGRQPVLALSEIAAWAVREHATENRRAKHFVDTSKLNLDEEAVERLRNLGLVDVRADEHGRVAVAIGQEWLENYIVGFHLRRWDRASPDQLHTERDEILSNPLLYAVADWLGEFLDNERRAALAGPATEAAAEYARTLTELLHAVPCCSPRFPFTNVVPILVGTPSFLRPRVIGGFYEGPTEAPYLWADELRESEIPPYSDKQSFFAFEGEEVARKAARRRFRKLLRAAHDLPPEPVWVPSLAGELTRALLRCHRDELRAHPAHPSPAIKAAVLALRSREFHQHRVGKERTLVENVYENDKRKWSVGQYTVADEDDPEVVAAVEADVRQETLQSTGPEWSSLLWDLLSRPREAAVEAQDREFYLKLEWPLAGEHRNAIETEVRGILEGAVKAFPDYIAKCVTSDGVAPAIHPDSTRVWFDVGPKFPWKQWLLDRHPRYVVGFAMAVLHDDEPGVEVDFLDSWDDSRVLDLATGQLPNETRSTIVATGVWQRALADFFCPQHIVRVDDHPMKKAEEYAPMRALVFDWLRRGLPKHETDQEDLIDRVLHEKR